VDGDEVRVMGQGRKIRADDGKPAISWSAHGARRARTAHDQQPQMLLPRAAGLLRVG